MTFSFDDIHSNCNCLNAPQSRGRRYIFGFPLFATITKLCTPKSSCGICTERSGKLCTQPLSKSCAQSSKLRKLCSSTVSTKFISFMSTVRSNRSMLFIFTTCPSLPSRSSLSSSSRYLIQNFYQSYSIF